MELLEATVCDFEWVARFAEALLEEVQKVLVVLRVRARARVVAATLVVTLGLLEGAILEKGLGGADESTTKEVRHKREAHHGQPRFDRPSKQRESGAVQ